MNIVLNDALEQIEIKETQWSNKQTRYKALLDKIQSKVKTHSSKPTGGEWVNINFNVDSCDTFGGLLQLIANAYNRHEKLEIGPHDLWYLTLSELAIAIQQNSELCRPIFTKSTEKVSIAVPTGSIELLPIESIVARLTELMPIDIELLLPKISTADANCQLAMSGALCDAVQNYYDYMTFMCGIPEIRVTGTDLDWTTLMLCIYQLKPIFAEVGATKIVDYLSRIEILYQKIAAGVNGTMSDQEQIDFWSAIFTARNIGSGSQLSISGWIVDFFYETRGLPKLENFTNSMSLVPFTNKDTGNQYIAVYGAFGHARTDDNFIKTVYGSFTTKIISQNS